jgi:signal transduction histidine kinase
MDTKEENIYTLILIAAVVLAVILGYFIFNIIRQQKRTRQLHLDNIQAEIRALERERQRIASDLHDDLGPLLSAVKFKINAVDIAGEADRELMETANRHIDDSISRIREISFDLMPSALNRKGLIAAIEELIPKTEKIFPIKIHFTHSGSAALKPELMINLYRMILEVIQNTIKHANASVLFLNLSMDEKKIDLKSEDNGIGFDLEEAKENSKGLGLKNLYSRAEVMQGELMIEAVPGKGVSYHLVAPVK